MVINGGQIIFIEADHALCLSSIDLRAQRAASIVYRAPHKCLVSGLVGAHHLVLVKQPNFVQKPISSFLEQQVVLIGLLIFFRLLLY